MLIAAGCVSCQPTLEPPTGHFCPEVNVTYSCHDSQVMAMAWFAEPYFSGNQGIKYAPGFTTNVTRKRGDYFYTQATSFSVDMEKNMFLSMTTTLTVITSGLENGTNITCLTTRGGGSSILYFAGNGLKIIWIASHILAAFLLLDVPHWKNMSKIFLENNATATIELGDMFYGGGVPIDHYIIQVEDGTVLETPGPTYSFDIMYNTSLSVNISAHNCAGYSDPFPLVLQYGEG